MRPPPIAPSQRAAALAATAAQAVIAAATFVVAKSALSSFGPLQLSGLRMIGAAILMGATAAVAAPGTRRARERSRDRSGQRRSWRPHLGEVVFLGVIGITVNQICFISGLARSTPTHAALLYALTPAIVHLLALAAGDERPTIIRGGGIALAFTGAAVVIGGQGAAQRAATLHGDLLILVAVFAWALYSARARRPAQMLGVLRFTAFALVSGAAAGLVVVTPSLLRLEPAAIPASAWAGVGFLVVFTSGIAYVLWSFALRRLEASQVAISANAQPVLTALLSHVVLGEPITLAVVTGGVFVIAGVVLTQTEVAGGRMAA